MFTESIYDILATLLLIAAGVCYKGAYTLAQKQKLFAAKLDAHLTYWETRLFGDADKQKIFFGDGKMQALREVLLMISAKEKNAWQEIPRIKYQVYQEIEGNYKEHHEDSLIEEAAMLQEQVEIFPEGISFLHRQAEASIQNILNGNLFISDNEVGTLGYFYVRTCFRLKMNIVTFLKEEMQRNALMTSDDQKFRDRIKPTYFSSNWRMRLILVDMNILSDKVKPLEDRTVHRMAWRNLWGKPAD